ncbi:MAG: hypothetical protein ACU4F9_04240 [Arcticibacter sp.]
MKTLFISLLLLFANPLAGSFAEKNTIAGNSIVLICESPNAVAYHAGYCRGLQRCTHNVARVSVTDAQKYGYRACQICYN